jgi:hypothetical protein
MIPISAF